MKTNNEGNFIIFVKFIHGSEIPCAHVNEHKKQQLKETK